MGWEGTWDRYINTGVKVNGIGRCMELKGAWDKEVNGMNIRGMGRSMGWEGQ